MFHVGVLYRIGDLLELVDRLPLTTQTFLNDFRIWQGVSGNLALEVAIRAGWVREGPDKILRVSEQGHKIFTSRTPSLRLRAQIKQIVALENPAWIRLAIRGREAVRTYAPPEALQCLDEAGLLSANDRDTVLWWDEIASTAREDRNSDLLQVGRRGERLSMVLETERTGNEPLWVALETTDAGYDLLSRVNKSDDSRLHIEVKTSEFPWEQAMFYVTRNEWLFLTSVSHASFHLWCVNDSIPIVGVVPIQEVEAHIPADKGAGSWREVQIPFRAVSDQPFSFPDCGEAVK